MVRMMRNHSGALALVAFALAAALAPACRAKSDRDLVADVIDDMAAKVERRDAAGLVAHLAVAYSDFEGRDREATRAMAEEYFGRYRGIKTKVLASRIALAEEGTATVETDVSLYSGVGAALRQAVGFSGENYRVFCTLRKEKAWVVMAARWEYVPLEGLFPESLRTLRSIFPGL